MTALAKCLIIMGSPSLSYSDETTEAKPSRPAAALQYSEVVPGAGDGGKKFSIKHNSEYAQIDHTETERVRQVYTQN